MDDDWGTPVDGGLQILAVILRTKLVPERHSLQGNRAL